MVSREKSVFQIFQRISFEIQEILESPQTVENKGESEYCLEILENVGILKVLEILEIPGVKRPFRNDPFFRSRQNPTVIIIRGKVGIAMNEVSTSDWRKSGQKAWAMGHLDDTHTHRETYTTGWLQLNARGLAGWKRGWFFVAGYAPMAKDEAQGEHDRFWETMHQVLAKSRGGPEDGDLG